MTNPYFIVNPAAGASTSLQKFAAVEAELRRRGIVYNTLYSERPGHASELTRQALAAGAGCVVAVGGDGTVQEVAAELMGIHQSFAMHTQGASTHDHIAQGRRIPMGILPFGTGNDVIKALGVPLEPGAALELLLSGKIRLIDLAAANNRPFVNVAGLGFDVEVLDKTRHYKAWFRGIFAYILGVLHALFALRSYRVVVTTTERQTLRLDALMVSVGNGTHIGGGMKVTPDADMSDGLLDVCVVRRVGRFKILRSLPKFIRGNHIHMDITSYFRATEITVESSPEARVQMDGEIVEKTPVHFSVKPAALWVIAPEP